MILKLGLARNRFRGTAPPHHGYAICPLQIDRGER
jgi:hypothetical protein